MIPLNPLQRSTLAALIVGIIVAGAIAAAANEPQDLFSHRSAWLKGNELHTLGQRRIDGRRNLLIRRRTGLVAETGRKELEAISAIVCRLVGNADAIKAFPTRMRYDGKYVWVIEPRDTSSIRVLSPNFAALRVDEHWFTSDGKYENPPAELWGKVVQQSNMVLRRDTLLSRGHSHFDVGDPHLKDLYSSFYYEMDIDERGASKYGRPINGAVSFGDLPKAASYDFLPVGPQKYRLVFVSEPVDYRRLLLPPTKERTAFILEYEFVAVEDLSTRSTGWRGAWTLADQVETQFVAPFRYVTAADQHYFVLDDGRLFGTRGSLPGTDRKADEIRLRGGELIQTVIYDLDRAGAAFAFTSKYWFELKQPIEYHDFEMGSLREEVLPATLETCAREIRRSFPAVAAGPSPRTQEKLPNSQPRP